MNDDRLSQIRYRNLKLYLKKKILRKILQVKFQCKIYSHYTFNCELANLKAAAVKELA